MFENMIYKDIRDVALASVPKSVDKRPGSIIYDAIDKACLRVLQVYVDLNRVSNEIFPDTASRENLIRRAKERGLEPYTAKNAIRKGEFDIEVPIGSRFNLDDLNYEVIYFIGIEDGMYMYALRCETVGSIGNEYFGAMVPIENISGLKVQNLKEGAIESGRDEEDTEDFRARYFESIKPTAYGGNEEDYKKKVKETGEVGGVKVYRTPQNIGGTVKLIITNLDFEKPSDYLINSVKDIIDLEDGKGYGLAPMGHRVTVEGVKETEIYVKIKLAFGVDGYEEYEVDKESLEEEAATVITNYFQSVNEEWESVDCIVVYPNNIVYELLEALKYTGITNVVDVCLYDGEDNEIEVDLYGAVKLEEDYIAVLGGVEID